DTDSWIHSPDPITPDPNAGVAINMQLVDGNPAICAGAQYVRAVDQPGSAWGDWWWINFDGSGPGGSMCIVAGKPAVVLPGLTEIQYALAFDSDGARWGDPQTVDQNGWIYLDPYIAVI